MENIFSDKFETVVHVLNVDISEMVVQLAGALIRRKVTKSKIFSRKLPESTPEKGLCANCTIGILSNEKYRTFERERTVV